MSFDPTGLSSDSRRQAAEASTEAASAKRDVAQLETDLARMKLVCAAVWELVKERAKLTEDDLVAKVAELDARDGIVDGKLARKPTKCSQCGRTVSPKQIKCMYCGAVPALTSVFEGI